MSIELYYTYNGLRKKVSCEADIEEYRKSKEEQAERILDNLLINLRQYPYGDLSRIKDNIENIENCLNYNCDKLKHHSDELSDDLADLVEYIENQKLELKALRNMESVLLLDTLHIPRKHSGSTYFYMKFGESGHDYIESQIRKYREEHVCR